MGRRLYVQIGARERMVEIEERDGRLALRVDGEPRQVELFEVGDGQSYTLRLGDRNWEILAERAGAGLTLLANGVPFTAAVRDERERRVEAAGLGDPLGASRHAGRTEVRAPMPGLVVGVAVSPGDTINA